jgi:type I site-specific restriction-modification system R (restriction) subunit
MAGTANSAADRCTNSMDLVENFIVFDESAGEPRKILARNHQFLGVNRAVAAVRHYTKAWETGKAMLVCIDKITCVRMHKLITFYWDEHIRKMEKSLPKAADEQEEMYRHRQLQWMKETRMAREGLDEESLALFDLLKKPKLSSREIKRIKAVAVNLLKTIKTRISRIDHWTTREATRDTVRLTIQDFLWEESSGLPVAHYTDHDVEIRTEEVFRHVYRVYPTLPSPYYDSRPAA